MLRKRFKNVFYLNNLTNTVQMIHYQPQIIILTQIMPMYIIFTQIIPVLLSKYPNVEFGSRTPDLGKNFKFCDFFRNDLSNIILMIP